MPRKSNPEKALEHISKGDRHLEKDKPARALKEYLKARDLDPDAPGIYDRLNRAHDRTGGDWKMEDFADSVSWTMEKQAQEHPEIKQVHARLSPEWVKASELAYRILSSEDSSSTTEAVEQLVAMGEIATRAVIGILMDLRHAGEEAPSRAAQPPEESE